MPKNLALIDIESAFRLGRRSLADISIDAPVYLTSPRKSPVPAADRVRPAKAVGAIRRILTQGARTSARSKQRAPSGQKQRVAVRVNYQANKTKGQWAAHGSYIERKGAMRAGESAYGQDGAVSAKVSMAMWQEAGDERVFKIIISPEIGDRLDMSKLTRDTMGALELRLGRKFEWCAANHYDTDYPHTHVVLRGVDRDGKEVYLPKGVVKTELRQMARDAATRQIGYRTQSDKEHAMSKRATEWRWTQLDDALVAGRQVPQGYAEKRLRFFAKAGLVEAGVLAPNAGEVVRAIAIASDRQRAIASAQQALSEPRLPVQVGVDAATGPVRVVAAHETHTLVESPTRICFVPMALNVRVGTVVDSATWRKVEPRFWESEQGRALVGQLSKRQLAKGWDAARAKGPAMGIGD